MMNRHMVCMDEWPDVITLSLEQEENDPFQSTYFPICPFFPAAPSPALVARFGRSGHCGGTWYR
ncbi:MULTISPECIES: hypothetical protein [Bradyrhizobium]|nr:MULTISPECIES: hypothetical protein [Bradyrhizobium]